MKNGFSDAVDFDASDISEALATNFLDDDVVFRSEDFDDRPEIFITDMKNDFLMIDRDL